MKRNNEFKREDKENDFEVFMEYPVKKKKVDLEPQYVVPWQIMHEKKTVEH